MNAHHQELDPKDSSTIFDENLACELCGRFEAVRIAGRALCETCYQGCGSCCSEFGGAHES